MDAQNVTEVAKGISDYGMMAVTAAIYLLLSAAMMIAIFKWFKTIINRILGQQTESMKQLAEIQSENNRMLKFMSENRDNASYQKPYRLCL